MREVLALEAPFKPDEVAACMGGGTKGLTKAYWADLDALQ